MFELAEFLKSTPIIKPSVFAPFTSLCYLRDQRFTSVIELLALARLAHPSTVFSLVKVLCCRIHFGGNLNLPGIGIIKVLGHYHGLG